MGVSHYPSRGPVKSIQVKNVDVNMSASSSGTVTVTITSVDTDKSIVFPPSMYSSMDGAVNFSAIRCYLSDSTTLTVAWENDTSVDPSAITITAVVVEYY